MSDKQVRGANGLLPHHPFISAEARDLFLADYDELASSRPLNWELSTLVTQSGSTYVCSRGPQDGKPLVLLPGAGGDSAQWPVDFIDALSRTYRVHSLDNIVDFGRSASARPLRAVRDSLVWLDEVLDALSPGVPVILIGGSRGAWLSAEYSLYAPDRLVANVWMSPSLVVAGWGLGAVTFVILSTRAMRRPTTENVDAMLRWLLPAYADQDPAEFQRLMVDHTALSIRTFDLKEVGRGWGPRRLRSSELASISVPTLFIAGADERLTSTQAAVARLAKVAPQIQSAIVPHSGHDMLWVQTRQLTERVCAFLDTVANGS